MKNRLLGLLLAVVLVSPVQVFADYNNLNEALSDTTTQIKTYNLTEDENVYTNLAKLKGTELTINGNGYDIVSSSNSFGFFVAGAGKTLKINDIGMMSGFSQQFGGAIYNESTVIVGDNIAFDSNSSDGGGAIYNGNTLTIGNNVIFDSNKSNSLGGAIYNEGEITIGDNATFSSNKATSLGGAIYNNEGEVTIGDNVTFSSNTVNLFGGAIYNNKGMVTIGSNAIFNSNKGGVFSSSSGGAIYNNEGMVTIGSNAIFSLNKNGTIYSSSGTIIMDKGIVFDSNEIANGTGGAIYSDYSTIMIGDDVIFNSNKVSNGLGGGAIYNNEGEVTIGNNGVFSSNKALNGASGGAIYNKGEVTVGNNATFSSNTSSIGGGAIFNDNILTIGNNINFISNNASNGAGGAIYNKGEVTVGNNATFSSNTSIIGGGAILNDNILTIQDGAKFINNTTADDGGAILNLGTLNLIAKTNNIEFTGNKAKNSISNAIHNDGVVNLITSEKATIIFNDRITGSGDLNIIVDKIILNEDMSDYTGNTNIYSGTIDLYEKGKIFGGNLTIDNATINLANSVIQECEFENLTVNTALNLQVDADLQEKKMDTISADTYTGDKKINVKAINILKYTDQKETSLEFVKSDNMKQNVTTSVAKAYSDVDEYDVIYNQTTGNMNFSKKGESPIAQESAATSVQSYANQIIVVNQIFDLDMMGKKRGLWLKPFVSNDKMDLGAVSDVDNKIYGTLAGYSMPVEDDKLVSFYIGYTSGKQEYENVKTTQNSYMLGATGKLIREKWYVGATVNVGMNKSTSDNDFGSDDIDKTTYSIGFKGGYDFDLGKNWILEPNMILMYLGATSNNFTNAQGNKVEDNGINGILIQPQVKASWKLAKGWAPYGLVDVAINTGESKPKVNDIELEAVKLSPYFEYGLGVNKEFIDTAWSCYGEVIGRSGSRKGVGFNCGVKYAF